MLTSLWGRTWSSTVLQHHVTMFTVMLLTHIVIILKREELRELQPAKWFMMFNQPVLKLSIASSDPMNSRVYIDVFCQQVLWQILKWVDQYAQNLITSFLHDLLSELSRTWRLQVVCRPNGRSWLSMTSCLGSHFALESQAIWVPAQLWVLASMGPSRLLWVPAELYSCLSLDLQIYVFECTWWFLHTAHNSLL